MPALKSKTLLRTYMWRAVGTEGLERGELLQAERHWIMSGTILRLPDSGPAEVKYEIISDAQWCTRIVNVSRQNDQGKKELHITRAPSEQRATQRWRWKLAFQLHRSGQRCLMRPRSGWRFEMSYQ